MARGGSEHGEPVDISIGGRTVRISSPNRMYFPQIGATKLDVVRYYQAVSPAIVRALANRPTMLHRYPQGIDGAKVHQKRIPAGAPEWLDTVQIHFPRFDRTADEVVVTEPAAVIWAAQMSTVEFHPWNCRRGDLDHPDEWRIDLDPMPDCSFERVRSVAAVVREVLDELGVRGFPKTSGGSGLHVYVRIEPRWTFSEVRRAALAFAREVELRMPAEVTTAWWRKERDPAAVFIDYNQNARDHTIACAYSLRGTARARASAPLAWGEIDGIHPDDFTITTVPARLAEIGDLHAEIDDRAFGIDALLAWADRDNLPHE